MGKLIIPKNLNKWFKELPKTDKEDIYKFWLHEDCYFRVIKAPRFVEPIEYFKHLEKATTTNAREE